MKTQSTHLFNAISKADFVNLISEVKETLDAGFEEKRSKIISAADVWNIQRQKRNRIQRRYSL